MHSRGCERADKVILSCKTGMDQIEEWSPSSEGDHAMHSFAQPVPSALLICTIAVTLQSAALSQLLRLVAHSAAVKSACPPKPWAQQRCNGA